MKIYTAKIKHPTYEAEYRVRAESIEEAYAKIYKMCGVPNIKVKEL